MIYRIGQLGDTLAALPAVEAIKRKHAGDRIVLLTDCHKGGKKYVSSWDVIGPTQWVDEVIFYEPSGLSVFKRIKQFFTLLIKLRQYGFHCVYNMVFRTTIQNERRDFFFFWLLVGIRHYKGRMPLPYPPRKTNEGFLPMMEPEWSRLMDLVDKQPAKFFRLPIPTYAKYEALDLIDSIQRQSKCLIAFSPGSKMSAKRWPETQFVELGRRLIAEYSDIKILIVGGEADFDLGERICRLWDKNGVNLSGKFSIYGTAALLKNCNLFVGNDSGAMHLAAMAGVPCVALFSARDYPGLWEPYGKNHSILRKDIDCCGCMLETCIEHRNACLEQISVDVVFSAVIDQLQRNISIDVKAG